MLHARTIGATQSHMEREAVLANIRRQLGLFGLELHLRITERGHVKLLGKGDRPINLAQAATKLLLEALQMQRQHLWSPATSTHSHFRLLVLYQSHSCTWTTYSDR